MNLRWKACSLGLWKIKKKTERASLTLDLQGSREPL